MKENALSEFGIEVKTEMIKRGMKQVELIQLVKEDTGLYVDDGYMYRILRGERSPDKIVDSIRKILGIGGAA